MRRSRRLLCSLTVIIATACQARYPTSPSQPTTVGLQLHVAQPFGVASVNLLYRFTAYSVRSDTAWEDVTSKAEWLVSDTAVLRTSSAGSFVAVRTGRASVLVRYGGLTDFADIEVVNPAAMPFPRLSLLPAAPGTTGETAQASLLVLQSPTSSVTVTQDAIWSSSAPDVAVVDRGIVRAIRPGTATITAQYQNQSSYFRLSVPPFSR